MPEAKGSGERPPSPVSAGGGGCIPSAQGGGGGGGEGERGCSSDPPYHGAYRADGVRILHNPNDPRMAEKYGKPGATDNEGFDPYADTVGAGIYGGIVMRDKAGQVVVGKQYQNHNPTPGPVYAGGGYTPMATAIHDGPEAVAAFLDKYPDMVNDVSTGGAQPLHICGMSQRGQLSTELIIARGGDVEATDTYG